MCGTDEACKLQFERSKLFSKDVNKYKIYFVKGRYIMFRRYRKGDIDVQFVV